MATNYVERKDEQVDGQNQKVHVREAVVTPDEPVLDPNSDLAVQIPKGVGADGTEQPHPVETVHTGPTPLEADYSDGSKDSAVTDEVAKTRTSRATRAGQKAGRDK